MGGTRFKVGSPEYDIISHWIASGLPAPRDSDPRLKSLDVSPARPDARRRRDAAAARDGAFHRWLDRRRRHGGRSTGSADETVAHVEDDGQVSIKGPGETAVSVSFLTGVALARVRSPYPVSIPDSAFTQTGRRRRHRRSRARTSCASCTSHLLPSAPTASSSAAPISMPRDPSNAAGGRVVSRRHGAEQAGAGSSTGCSSATSSSTTGPTSGRMCCSSRAAPSARTTCATSTAGFARL